MIIHHLGENPSILNRFVAELRDVNIQKDRMRFRKNLERIGEILCYEMSKNLHFEKESITTPLGEKEMQIPKDEVVICSILRAGLALHQGLMNFFDGADNAFISAYRKHTSETEFDILVEYLASPSLENKTLFLADPMLATGRSFVNVYEALSPLGKPKSIHLFAVVGAEEGVEYLKDKFPADTHLWIATIDPKLNEKGYIIPGLGDAGDLAFGDKMQQ
ncbi:uracil phosphoribosyltransferase [Capnocytophaga stomatis]|uniref:Uracil phosphoribosyltransferase n=1 Tax=Capnocytophaga stomatis TaxID=1848904 RepID=A0A250FXN2_9FLAO|nr:uracil phosphoribosyltransferase [Capnocytophaga stomatis]ATA88848.1 uracil phosphoribosyltransferase [Capnocytophaga stomatis]GIJ94573.1 uracil phosphoribosyltransferase [Capnocytophaga stomatis]GIJ96961.1 uracil phosphoribosyltransferase [Capnocytophaga stomatis]GIM50557.1 uracil phosphoribosyltransferase [Capnocytophaga stomatis]